MPLAQQHRPEYRRAPVVSQELQISFKVFQVLEQALLLLFNRHPTQVALSNNSHNLVKAKVNLPNKMHFHNS